MKGSLTALIDGLVEQLRFQDYKSVVAYNSVMQQITT